jgi:hypothetical protein
LSNRVHQNHTTVAPVKSAKLAQILKIAAGLCLAMQSFFAFFAQPALASAVVADLETFPQLAAAYAPANPDARLARHEDQRVYAEEYLRSRFAPWHNEDISYLDLSIDSVVAFHAAMAKKQYFTSDGKPFPRASMDRLSENGFIDVDALVPRSGVTLTETNVRVLPTATALYPSAASARGERGLLPLDSMQNTALKPGEPLAVYTMSQDSSWCFIATDAVVGWVRAKSVALVDEDFMDRYIFADQCVAVRDNIRVNDARGDRVCTIKMGAVLPREEANILLPVRGKQGFAEIVAYHAAEDDFAPFPVPFTPSNALRAVDQLLGERYGWGGSDGLRDCSAMTRDYFALFGIWLPRNSGDQAKTGAVLPLRNVQPGLRTQTIAERGVPFATLVHMPGHIMLYLGLYDGKPVVLHNMWGIRTTLPSGESGRAVVGRTVVTSLRAGAEIPERAKTALFVDNLAALAYPMANVGVQRM